MLHLLNPAVIMHMYLAGRLIYAIHTSIYFKIEVDFIMLIARGIRKGK